jgi:2-methylcitrate dehydratase PrpD
MITRRLAKEIMEISYEKIPADVIYKAKLCFLDFLGVSLRGSKNPNCESIQQIFNSKEEATILGHKMASSTDSAFCNGIFAHSMDLDDGHRFAHLHPGCAVIPAALALSEARNKNGRDFIESIVAGYQVSILMGIISNPEHRNNGFHSTGTCGTFGAAAASAKIIGLGIEDTINSLGLAGTQASGLLESDHAGSMAKHLHAGKAAQSGVISSLLAENGFTGADSIVEGSEGFLNAMVCRGNDHYTKFIDKIIMNSKYHISDVYFKKYPVCRHLHPSIDAVMTINKKMLKDGVKPEDIKSVEVRTYKIAAEHHNYKPKTIEDVRQSLPFALAISLLEGNLNIKNIKINSEINSLAKIINIKHDSAMELSYPSRRASKVTVISKNHVYTICVDLPKGEPENPFNKSDIKNKFNELNPEFDTYIFNMIDELENYKIRGFMEMFREIAFSK